jgi:hypothetical protein
MVAVRSRSQIIAIGLLFGLAGCATDSSPVGEARPSPYGQLSVAVVEGKDLGGKFNAGVFDDMTKLLVANFGTVMMAKTVEEATAAKPDLIAVLSVDSDVATHIFANGRVDVHARFLTPDNQIFEELHAHGTQRARPFLQPYEINEASRSKAREQMQAALANSVKLAEFAKAKSSGLLAGSKPATLKTPAPGLMRSDVDTPTYRVLENPNNYAVVVGIEKYADLPDAEFALRDADAVRRHLLAMGYPSRNVIYLTGQNATRASIHKYLREWLPRNVRSDSRVFFYYSGHGAPDPKTGEAYLVPWDGDPRFLETTAYPVRDLYGALDKLPAGDVIVALDACFSGAGGRSVLAKGARPMGITVSPEALPHGKLVLFGAASGDEITSTLDDQGHGIFTYYFLKGLSGSAKTPSGAVTLKGLFDYLKPLVQDAARRQNRDQTPVLYGPQQDRVLVRLE